jgi:hypothetical protein
MAIQHPGGTIISTTFVGGTKLQIVNALNTQLKLAGWTAISGDGTGDVILESATTPTANNFIRVRLRDSAATNCAVLNMQNTSASKVSGNMFLLPAAAKTFRILANKYMFFCFTPGTTASREYWMCGTLWIPTDLHGVITGELGIASGNGNSDTDTTVRPSFRTLLQCHPFSGGGQAWSGLCNSNLSEIVNNGVTDAGPGGPRLIIPVAAQTSYYYIGYRWHDDSLDVSDPVIAWGLTNGNIDEAKKRGQLWGCMLLTDSFAADQVLTSFDGHDWWGITNSNAGTSQHARGTLFFATT